MRRRSTPHAARMLDDYLPVADAVIRHGARPARLREAHPWRNFSRVRRSVRRCRNGSGRTCRRWARAALCRGSSSCVPALRRTTWRMSAAPQSARRRWAWRRRPSPLPLDVTQARLLDELARLNAAPEVHGILLLRPLRPLPAHIDETAACKRHIAGQGCGRGDKCVACRRVLPGATARLWPRVRRRPALRCWIIMAWNLRASAPVVVGRSLVVGRPLAMLLLHRNATVTLCHTRTRGFGGGVSGGGHSGGRSRARGRRGRRACKRRAESCWTWASTCVRMGHCAATSPSTRWSRWWLPSRRCRAAWVR